MRIIDFCVTFTILKFQIKLENSNHGFVRPLSDLSFFIMDLFFSLWNGTDSLTWNPPLLKRPLFWERVFESILLYSPQSVTVESKSYR